MNKLSTILSTVLKLDSSKITDELSMTTTSSWDSMKHMEIIVGIEEAYGIQLTFDEISEMRSVGAIRQVLELKGLI